MRIRVGVVGLRRGLFPAGRCRRIGMRVVAACDRDAGRRDAAGKELPEVLLTDRWEDLLDLRLDGVVLANDSDAPAPLAIAFLGRGVHVLSERAACTSTAEGRLLVARRNGPPPPTPSPGTSLRGDKRGAVPAGASAPGATAHLIRRIPVPVLHRVTPTGPPTAGRPPSHR